MEEIQIGKATINFSFNETKILIPISKAWGNILFFSVWIIGWCFGEYFGWAGALGYIKLHTRNGSNPNFIWLWLTFWTVFGPAVISLLYWLINGKELITFSDNKLTLTYVGAIFVKPKVFELAVIKNFKSQTPPVEKTTREIKFFKNRVLTFEYQGETIWLASGINEEEGNQLLHLLRHKGILTNKNFGQ